MAIGLSRLDKNSSLRFVGLLVICVILQSFIAEWLIDVSRQGAVIAEATCRGTFLAKPISQFAALAGTATGNMAGLLTGFLLVGWLGLHLKRHATQASLHGQPGWSLWLVLFIATQTVVFRFVATPASMRQTEAVVDLLLVVTGLASIWYAVCRIYCLYRPATYMRALSEAWRMRLANGSIGRQDDVYQLGPAADDFARTLVATKSPVRAIGLYGNVGEGKSSFWRMTLESSLINPKAVLYTYISLTETNETTDLSHLFAERWYETLRERYPLEFSPSSQQVERMRSVLRESGSAGWALAGLRFADNFNRPLFKMQVADGGYDESLFNAAPAAVSNLEVRKIFNYLPRIQEEGWIICIDEIEQSPVAEIFRAIEIVERFKQIGQTGLPVPITFVFLYDQERLKKRCQEHRAQDDRYDLVANFFLDNPKSFTLKRRTPFVSEEAKMTYIHSQLVAMASDPIYNLPPISLDGVQPTAEIAHFVDGPPQLGLYDRRKTVDIVLQLLAQESQRTIKRVFDRLRDLYGSLPSNSTAEQFKRTYIPDLIAFILAEVKGMAAIELVANGHRRLFAHEGDQGMRFYHLRFIIEHEQQAVQAGVETEKSMWDKLESELGIAVGTDEHAATLHLLSIISPQLRLAIQTGEDMTHSQALMLKDRLAFPANLEVMLGQTARYTDGLAQNLGDYEAFIDSVQLPSEIENDGERLHQFVNFFRNQAGDDRYRPRHTLRLLRDIRLYLGERSVHYAMDLSEASPSYRLVVLFANLMNDIRQQHGSTPRYATRTHRYFSNLISDTRIPLTFRLKLFNLFCYYDDAHANEFNRTRTEVIEGSGKRLGVMERLYKRLKDEFEKQYVDSGKSIYQIEPDPFYVTRQFWNGRLNDAYLTVLQKVRRFNLAVVPDVVDQILLSRQYQVPGGFDSYGAYKAARARSASTFMSISNLERPDPLLPLPDLVWGMVRNSNLKHKMQVQTKPAPELLRRYTFWKEASQDPDVINREPIEDSDTITARINRAI